MINRLRQRGINSAPIALPRNFLTAPLSRSQYLQPCGFNDSILSQFDLLSARRANERARYDVRRYVAFKAPYATAPHDPTRAIPPSRAPINSPAAARRCALKVNRVSRYAPSRGHARFAERLSRRASFHGPIPPFTAPFASSSRCRGTGKLITARNNRDDKFRSDHATWDNRDERLHRTGAAPALRVYTEG